MTKHVKITLSGSRDIPFNQLVLSQANVRRVKAGVSIDALAADIARRGLLQSLTVRLQRDADGNDTGLFEVPAGGRRFRALQQLVKQRRMTKVQPVPCIVREDDEISAEEDSLAENTHREALHPLDQFRAMHQLVTQGSDVETVAATFMVTPAVVKQRLRLASVSPKLLDLYAEDGMTLEQLTAFSVTEDHARQELVWEQVQGSYQAEPYSIRRRLTENTVHSTDRRVRFVGLDAYTEAGGYVLRDLFEADDGGWLQDVAILDRLVEEKLQAEGARIGVEGWKWVAVAVDFPWNAAHGLRELRGEQPPLSEEDEARLAALRAEADALENEWADAPEIPEEAEARIAAVDEEIGAIVDRPQVYDPEEMARAGVFVSLDRDGSLFIERGLVRPEDEPSAELDEGEAGEDGATQEGPQPAIVGAAVPGAPAQSEGEDEAEEQVRPLPDRLVSELTAYRTIALQDAFAQSPEVAFAAVLHAMVLSVFFYASKESCLQLSLHQASFNQSAPGTRTFAPGQAIAERHNAWKERLPEADTDLWDAIQTLDADDQAALFAHCAANAVNAQWERVGPYDSRTSSAAVERRIAHSQVLARAVGLDMAASWTPTVANYLGQVTKARILEAIADAKDPAAASRLEKLGKADMAREAEQLLDGTGWLPEPMRTPEPVAETVEQSAANDGDMFDAMAATMQDTRLEPDLEDLLWAIGNIFHRAATRIERQLDDNEVAQRRSVRDQDGSEVRSVELERLLREGATLIERRDAMEFFREASADQFRLHINRAWTPRSGSLVNRKALTAAMVDSRDFIAARKRADATVLIPVGTRIAITGGADYQDHRRIWDALDKTFAKHPDMVLLHGGTPTGVEHIAECWARNRKVPTIAFRPDWNRHHKAAPFKRNDQLLAELPVGVLAFPGTGINANLADKARKMGIPIWRFH